MAKIHSKTTLDSERRVEKIASSLRDGAAGLAEGLSRQLGQDGWDVPRECVEQLTQSLVRVLRSRNQRLADATYERQEIADRGKECRRQRDEASREVYRLLVRMRRILHGTVGSSGVRAHFGKGKTSREPREVWRVACHLQKTLRSDDARRDLCGEIGSEEVFLHWARDLEEPLERLTFYLRQIEKAEADERRAVPAVERAKAEMREAQKLAYRLLEGLFGLAGSEDFVQRLRVRTSGAPEPANPAGTAPTSATTPPEPGEPA